MKLDVLPFALSVGIVWGLGLFILTWWLILFEGPTGDVTLLGRFYRGYSVSGLGSLVGVAWRFFDGVVGGAVFAWLYNCLSEKMARGSREQA